MKLNVYRWKYRRGSLLASLLPAWTCYVKTNCYGNLSEWMYKNCKDFVLREDWTGVYDVQIELRREQDAALFALTWGTGE
jgi:hypothetical protein